MVSGMVTHCGLGRLRDTLQLLLVYCCSFVVCGSCVVRSWFVARGLWLVVCGSWRRIQEDDLWYLVWSMVTHYATVLAGLQKFTEYQIQSKSHKRVGSSRIAISISPFVLRRKPRGTAIDPFTHIADKE
jgi:hypothetical protein